MDRARDELLARPGFAGDQHGRVRRRDARDPLQHLAQACRGPDDPARGGRGRRSPPAERGSRPRAAIGASGSPPRRARSRPPWRPAGPRPRGSRPRSGVKGRRRRAADHHRGHELVTHGQRQHDRALGTRVLHPAPVQPRVAADVVEDHRPALALHGVAHRGDVLPRVSPWRRLLPRPAGRRLPGSLRARAERCAGRSREPGRPRASWVTTPIRSIRTSPSSAPATASSTLDSSRCEFAACATARSAWYFASPDQPPSMVEANISAFLRRCKCIAGASYWLDAHGRHATSP